MDIDYRYECEAPKFRDFDRHSTGSLNSAWFDTHGTISLDNNDIHLLHEPYALSRHGRDVQRSTRMEDL